MSFSDLGRQVLQAQVEYALGNRAVHFDVSGVVKGIVDRLGFLDVDEIDPLVFEEILDRNRRISP